MRDTRRARLVFGLLIAVALVLITVDHRGGDVSALGPLRGVASSVFGAAEQAGAKVAAPVSDLFTMISSAPDARRRIDALQRENARLRSQLVAQRLDRSRAAELEGMLGLAGRGRYRLVAAQVVARRDVLGFEDAVEIDAGSKDGIRPDMTVLNDRGLVGRVVQAGASTSTVVLLSDPGSSAGARLEGGKELGLGESAGDRNLIKFRLLDSTAPLSVGHRIVSFGSEKGTPYVAGVPIGTIERVEATPGELTRTAYARAYADLTALDVVGVVVKVPDRDPRDSVLPPQPATVKAKAKDDEKVKKRRSDGSRADPADEREGSSSDRVNADRGRPR
jgi:rod shape-determining protein MreC